MVSNSAQLDRRTKQHTQFGVSASNGSRDMGRTKSWREKKRNKRKKEKKMNVDNPIKHPLRGSLIEKKRKKKKKEKKMNVDNPIKHPQWGSLMIRIMIMITITITIMITITITITMRQVLVRPVCDRGAIPRR